MNALAALTMRTMVKAAAIIGVVASVVVGIVSYLDYTEAVDRYDTVDAVVTSNPDIAYRGRSGTAEVIATITYHEQEIRSAVPTQTRTGDTVTAYYDTDDGELWRATTSGQRPYSNDILVDALAAFTIATFVAGVAICAMSFAAEVIVDKPRKRTARAVNAS